MARELARQARRSGHPPADDGAAGLLIGEINDAPAREHFLARFLEEAGFVQSPLGLQMRHIAEAAVNEPTRSPPDVPEGDTIFRTARTLHRALGGQTVTRFETVLPKLARVDYDTPLAGRTVESVEARGKWVLMHFSGDLILLTHMLMSGSWHIYRPGETWQRHRSHMRIVVETPAMLAVAFNVPVAEFHSAASLARREGFNRLGPAPLSPEFDAALAIANLAARPDLELGLALLDQTRAGRTRQRLQIRSRLRVRTQSLPQSRHTHAGPARGPGRHGAEIPAVPT